MFSAGTDYAVFLISRYHYYIRLGADSDQAVKRAGRTSLHGPLRVRAGLMGYPNQRSGCHSPCRRWSGSSGVEEPAHLFRAAKGVHLRANGVRGDGMSDGGQAFSAVVVDPLPVFAGLM